MTTHPHLEGLILALIHDMREKAAVATPFTEKLLSRYANELVGIRAALAALPGGGVDVEALTEALNRAGVPCTRGTVRFALSLSPTPPPHEADRNG